MLKGQLKLTDYILHWPLQENISFGPWWLGSRHNKLKGEVLPSLSKVFDLFQCSSQVSAYLQSWQTGCISQSKMVYTCTFILFPFLRRYSPKLTVQRSTRSYLGLGHLLSFCQACIGKSEDQSNDNSDKLPSAYLSLISQVSFLRVGLASRIMFIGI